MSHCGTELLHGEGRVPATRMDSVWHRALTGEGQIPVTCMDSAWHRALAGEGWVPVTRKDSVRHRALAGEEVGSCDPQGLSVAQSYWHGEEVGSTSLVWTRDIGSHRRRNISVSHRR